jgi:hypothetical protein
MGHKAKRSKERKTRASPSPNVTNPLDEGFPSTFAPAVVSYPVMPSILAAAAPHPDLNLSLAMHEELQLRIASDCKVLIQFKGIATQSAIRKLITYLEMALGDFPKNSDKSATQE